MKKLVFKELLIHSHKERRAKWVKFDKKRTLIYGVNDTGKSSLIKTLMMTFGASPTKINSRWKEVQPISLVKFQIDEIDYSILKDGRSYAVFNNDQTLIKNCTSITNELGPLLANLTDFKVKLPDKDNNVITPPPAFIFLPFYVDQDTGWSDSWKSFAGMQQLKKPIEPIIHYHTGIRPNEYYESKSELSSHIIELENLERENTTIKSILDGMREKLPSADFNIDIDEFKDEIEELLFECVSLKEIEEKHKASLVDLYNRKFSIDTQIDITNRVLIEAQKDYNYATDLLDDSVECPTCGAEYHNSFSERFEIAKDSNRCQELLRELTLELESVESTIQRENASLNKTMEQIAKLEQILQKKKGAIVLKDVIESAGRNELHKVFADKIKELREQMTSNKVKQADIAEKIKKLENKKRREEISSFYMDNTRIFLRDLDVHSMSGKDYKRIAGGIKDTGSSLPRSLTAYYFSIFKVIQRYSTAIFCPIVIDSPNQQAQDKGHRDKMLKFISENQPEGSQMILGIEELYDIDFGCPVVELTERYHLLQESEYGEVTDVINPYLKALRQDRGLLF